MPGIAFRGFREDLRTTVMIVAAEKIGGPLKVTQGGFNAGGVKASAGTHDRAGVVDFSVRGLTLAQINRRVRALRTVGFAAWHRFPSEGPWGQHIHAVAVGCDNLAPVAARQVIALRHGRNGLRSNRPDRHRGMHLPVTTYEAYVASIAPRPELTVGSRGESVKVAQRLLHVTADGAFGPVTAAAVNKLKVANGGPPDSTIGPKTWALLEGHR